MQQYAVRPLSSDVMYPSFLYTCSRSLCLASKCLSVDNRSSFIACMVASGSCFVGGVSSLAKSASFSVFSSKCRHSRIFESWKKKLLSHLEFSRRTLKCHVIFVKPSLVILSWFGLVGADTASQLALFPSPPWLSAYSTPDRATDV